MAVVGVVWGGLLEAGGEFAGGPVTGTVRPEEGMAGTWPDWAVQRTWMGYG